MAGAGNSWRVGLVVLAIGLFAAGCTNSEPDNAAADELAAASTTTEQTTTTEAETTTTAESTTTAEPTTTLSELQQQEADAREEIEQAVLSWQNFLRDTSIGPEGYGIEYTTGLLRQRLIELVQRRADEGQVQRSQGNERSEVISIDLDLSLIHI